MTIEEIRKLDREYLIPSDICGILGCSAYTINVIAREDAESGKHRLPFPVILLGTRVKIPRRAFIAVMTGEKQ